MEHHRLLSIRGNRWRSRTLIEIINIIVAQKMFSRRRLCLRDEQDEIPHALFHVIDEKIMLYKYDSRA